MPVEILSSVRRHDCVCCVPLPRVLYVGVILGAAFLRQFGRSLGHAVADRLCQMFLCAVVCLTYSAMVLALS